MKFLSLTLVLILCTAASVYLKRSAVPATTEPVLPMDTGTVVEVKPAGE